MEVTFMTGKMNTYMLQLNEKMSTWLDKRLPSLTERWWDDLVYSNLSPLQRDAVDNKGIHELKGLDLASILRVFDRNWFVITSTWFVNSRVRQQIRDMMSIRNAWAHITPDEISKEKVLNDMSIIIELMQAFDASQKETRDMESFVLDVEDDVDIQESPIVVTVKAPVINNGVSAEPNEIAVGSMVCLVSDPSKVGAVMTIDGDKYTVFMGAGPQTFFKEQIQLQVQKSESANLELDRLRVALTAYQISNPGSSSLYSLNAARIDFVPYQFRPALKMIKADSPRLLVADDVGVGKTIEAGLMLKEMEARSSVESVLIICPRPLVAERKWQLEMKRFDENFTQLNGQELQQCILEMDRDGDWPERHKKTIIPYSLFGEDVIEGTDSRSDKKKKQKGLRQLDPLPHFDLVIVDEAHTIRNANTWAYAGVELFTRSADAVVFLTATPLQNSNNDLYTLLNLLRPDKVFDKDSFQTMSEPNVYVNALLRIVRTQTVGWQEQAKEQITKILSTTWGRNVIQHNPNFASVFEFVNKSEVTREEKIEAIGMIESLHSFNGLITRTRRCDIENFCVRHTQTVKVQFTSAQHELYEILMDFEQSVLARLHGNQSIRFMMCTIMRQAASCIYGLAPFINDIVERKLYQIQEDGELYDEDIELGMDMEESIHDLAQQLVSLTAKLPEKDPKLEKLYEIIDKKQEEENNRIILFSSFRHTLSYVRRHLETKGYRVAQVDGSVPDEERYRIRERFLLERNMEDAVDILLFSEVGCEGLDYQFCDTMVNYDLPWNPMRIEQRIGRIDRRGQNSETVRIYNMITEDTIDAVIYDRCLSKIGVFEASIGDCSEILGSISDQIIKIMLNPDLTDEERTAKIEQMADNDIRRVQEIRRLEQEEKSLYGFDLSNIIQNKSIQDAENAWISPDNLSKLVDLYLSDYLGEGEYIRGNKANELRTMRISGEKKMLLKENLDEVQPVNVTDAYKIWNAYLNSNSAQLRVTYDATTAKNNRDIVFLTQMHPLILQASSFEKRLLPCEIRVRVDTDDIPSGNYDFLIYAWKYVGLRPDIKLIAVSDNETVCDNLLNYLFYAEDNNRDGYNHKESWSALEKIHYQKWHEAKEAYVKQVTNDCEFRVEQLRQTNTNRETILKGQINNATDEKILRMRTGQLDNMRKAYEKQKKVFEEAIKKADIHSELLVKGVLHVE